MKPPLVYVEYKPVWDIALTLAPVCGQLPTHLYFSEGVFGRRGLQLSLRGVYEEEQL